MRCGSTVARTTAVLATLAIMLTAPGRVEAHQTKFYGIDTIMSEQQLPAETTARIRLEVSNFSNRSSKARCVVRLTSYWSRCCDFGYEERAFDRSKRVRLRTIPYLGERTKRFTIRIPHPEMQDAGWDPSFVTSDVKHCHRAR